MIGKYVAAGETCSLGRVAGRLERLEDFRVLMPEPRSKNFEL